MKAREIIAHTLRDWHSVNAPEQAEATFGLLDSDEIHRLALRAFTEEWRRELRVKDENGVPKYASINVRDDNGKQVRLYKQTDLFDESDYAVAIKGHVVEARSHLRAAKALAADAAKRLGVQIEIPGIEAAS